MARRHSFAEIDRIYKEISRLKDELTSTHNRRERAEVLIGACILHGLDSPYLIKKWLRVAGLSPRHIVRVLDARTGPLPGEHLWQYDADYDRYRLLGEVGVRPPTSKAASLRSEPPPLSAHVQPRPHVEPARDTRSL